MGIRLSVIVPNRNGEATIRECLDRLFSSHHDSFEVIVVDDNSTDKSCSIIEKFPCRLVQLNHHVGASKARNIGASISRGDILFFTDADCLVQEDTLDSAEKLFVTHGAGTVIGGTYTLDPQDASFYSTFQSAYIHYSELKKVQQPDYIASHAMVISSSVFQNAGGFPEDFLPIIEDVEFSHRLHKLGYTLVMSPELQVQHNFGFQSMADSLRNGYLKSKYWTMYSIANKDLLADSGTASSELKVNVLSFFVSLGLLLTYLFSSNEIILFILAAFILTNICLNLKLFTIFHKAGAKMFFLFASLYYLFIYPFAVGAGALVGSLRFIAGSKLQGV